MSSPIEELEAQWAALEEEQARLVAEVPNMEPAVAARALRVLADRIGDLRSEYERELQRRRAVERDRETEDRGSPGTGSD